MNRRSFFTNLTKAAAGFAILPTATTYARKWAPAIKTWESEWIVNPVWASTEYEMSFIYHSSAQLAFLQNPDFIPILHKRIGNSPIRFKLNSSGVLERVPKIIEV
jgi:hypothetical protein